MRDSSGAMVAVLLILGIGPLIALLVFAIIGWCKIFKKAGIHPGKFFIPVYGGWLAWDIAGCGGLYIATMVLSGIASFISFIATLSTDRNIYTYRSYDTSAWTAALAAYIIVLIICFIFQIIFSCRLARVFGKSGGFAAGLIFLNPIFIIILGYGSAQYLNKKGLDSVAGTTETWQCGYCGAVNPRSRITCSACGREKDTTVPPQQ